MPAAPTATSVRPSRHARPKVSLTTTATSTPRSSASRCRRSRAEASASSGSSTSASPGTLEASMPAAATTQPCRVSTMRSGPRRATTRTDSASIARWRAASRSSPGSTATSRPSTLEITLLVTTTTSPSASQGAAAAIAPARSSPGENSGSPGTGWTERPAGGSGPRGVPRGAGGGRGRLRVGAEQRPLAGPAARDLGVVLRGDQPRIEEPAVGTGAVVPPDPFGAHLDAEHGQALVGHPADDGAADDGGD